MRLLRFVPLLLLALFAMPALASEALVGTITATTTKNNTDTAVPFTLNRGGRYALQCDAAAYVRSGSASNTTVTSSNGVKLSADVLFDIPLAATDRYIAVVSVSGTANCKVFSVSP